MGLRKPKNLNPNLGLELQCSCFPSANLPVASSTYRGTSLMRNAYPPRITIRP